ncbi:hypothetical protein TNIN_112431 [Trichonephila inaurata madagascariensis]|uniref:Uncharacterized protein n=1 Tax=Trichonephila inaurata madagascariensis TaxID=2747483 RepID=A0A8X6XAR9_9ARAC|nr:hypothetical protein TNIN_112431 [Trichonephila inaurata madagascariensis]
MHGDEDFGPRPGLLTERVFYFRQMDRVRQKFSVALIQCSGKGKEKRNVRMDRVRQKLFCFSHGHNVTEMERKKQNSVRMDRVRQKLSAFCPGDKFSEMERKKMNMLSSAKACFCHGTFFGNGKGKNE